MQRAIAELERSVPGWPCPIGASPELGEQGIAIDQLEQPLDRTQPRTGERLNGRQVWQSMSDRDVEERQRGPAGISFAERMPESGEVPLDLSIIEPRARGDDVTALCDLIGCEVNSDERDQVARDCQPQRRR